MMNKRRTVQDKAAAKKNYRYTDRIEFLGVGVDENTDRYVRWRKLSGLIRAWGYNGSEVEIKANGIVVLPTCSSEEEHDKTNIWLTSDRSSCAPR
jgi:hypothetical protein